MVRISYGPAMLRVLSDVLGVLLAGLLLADLAGGAVRAAGLRFANLPDTRPSSTSLLELPPLLPRIVPRALTADPDEEVRLKGDPDPEKVQDQDEGHKEQVQDQAQAEGALLGTRVRPLGGRRLAATPAPAPDQQANEIEPRKKHVEDDDDEDDEDDDDEEEDDEEEEDEEEDEDDKVDLLKDPGKTFKIKKHKLKKWLLPLLVGYKLKFMTLVPLLFATLALLVASAGFAGFFFAMFTAALTLPKHSSH